jgi:hypothetical protein
LFLIIYTCETRRTNNLTAESLRLQHGARVRANFLMGWFDVANGKTPNVVIMVQNDSTIPAESVELNAQLQFRKSAPKPPASNFSRGEPQAVTSNNIRGKGQPGVLLPHTVVPDTAGYGRVVVINSDEYRTYKLGQTNLYFWGTIYFKDDLSKSPEPITFCRFVSVKEVPFADSDKQDGKWGDGYTGGYQECRRP